MIPRTSVGLWITGAVAAAIPATDALAVLYSYHNGYGSTDHVDVALRDNGDTTPVDMWWANEFTAQPGGHLITDISVAFGGGWTLGQEIAIVLYQDLNADPAIADLVLLTQMSATIDEFHNTGDANSVQQFDIPDTLVSNGSFFAGVVALNVSGQSQIRSELTGGQYKSWVAFNETAELLDTLDPANPDGAEQSPIRIENLLTPPQNTGIIDWYVEANGTVPEPSSMLALIAAGGLSALGRHRRRGSPRAR